jgi:hypothetical protein
MHIFTRLAMSICLKVDCPDTLFLCQNMILMSVYKSWEFNAQVNDTQFLTSNRLDI